jgi:myo-inositol 2-dehydrogenase/D-chiro-inositol 1-dehydrogenase
MITSASAAIRLAALEAAPAAKWFPSIEEAIAAKAMDAVLIATPG